MKCERYTIGDKIRIPREGDRGRCILEVYRTHNTSELERGNDE